MSTESASSLRIALVQMCSSSDMAANLIQAETWIKQAAESGVDMVVLPESFSLMERYDGQKLEYLQDEQFQNVMKCVNEQRATALLADNIRQWLRVMAISYNVCLVGGTVAVASDEPARPYARTYVFDKSGSELAHYDKIHLFDVNVSKGESYSESKGTKAGSTAASFKYKGFRCSLSVCYDLRFPEMYRHYSQQGTDIIFAPSAFTQKTGAAHWALLLKARAVENLSFVVAPNQTGQHDNGRATYGHSMAVNPWGETLAQLNEELGVVIVDIHKTVLEKIRATFPALQHRQM